MRWRFSSREAADHVLTNALGDAEGAPSVLQVPQPDAPKAGAHNDRE